MNVMRMRKPNGRAQLLTATATLSAAGLTPALAEESQRYYYGPHMWDGGWWMFLGPLWMIAFLGVLIGVAVLLVRWLAGPSGGAGGPAATKTPLDILRERFARGEIDKEEFEERKRVLGE
jgi:putative membrane protein